MKRKKYKAKGKTLREKDEQIDLRINDEKVESVRHYHSGQALDQWSSQVKEDKSHRCNNYLNNGHAFGCGLQGDFHLESHCRHLN